MGEIVFLAFLAEVTGLWGQGGGLLGKGLPGGKAGVFRHIRELETKSKTSFLKALQRVSNSWGPLRSSQFLFPLLWRRAKTF